ncbi:unnamed protein product, partial [Prorocentrum cordatum]
MEWERQRQKGALANAAIEKDKQLIAKDLEIAKLREQVLAAKAPTSGLEAERAAIKSRIIGSKPHSAQMHHFTTRIDELAKSSFQQEKALATLEAQKVELEPKIESVQKSIKGLTTDIAELEHQRFQVSVQLPTPLPEAYTLKTMVPALDLPVDKLGKLFESAGADTNLLNQATACFE